MYTGLGATICTDVDPTTGACTAAENADTLTPTSATTANVESWIASNQTIAYAGMALLFVLLFGGGRRR